MLLSCAPTCMGTTADGECACIAMLQHDPRGVACMGCACTGRGAGFACCRSLL